MGNSFELDDLDRFTAGTVGPRGQRVFYIQAVEGAEVVSLRLEKQQVLALADYLATVLDDLPQPSEAAMIDTDLVEPVIAEWVVGNIGVAYAESDDRVVLWADELLDQDQDGDDPDVEQGTARFRVSRPLVAAFILQARELAAAGRPPCPYCGRPLDGDGSWCACHN
jgi:uncharacterized repeat protein (TIGR03847 family)